MNVKTVSVTYERKLNLGDYNSAAIGVTVWADLEEDEDPTTAVRACFDLAKAAVKEQALPLVAKQTARVQEFFAGKPVETAATTN